VAGRRQLRRDVHDFAVTRNTAGEEHLCGLARLRRVRDRIDREFSTRFTELVGMPTSAYRRQAPRATAEMPPCVAKQVTRPIGNREAPVGKPQLA
jgi:hypothetical protein